MASSPSVTTLGETYSQMVTSGTYPTELRRPEVSEGTKLTYITRDISAFTYMISKNNPFTGKTTVNDRKFYTRELTELQRFYTVTVASSDTYHKTFGLANAEAAEIQPDNILFLMGVYATVAFTPLVAGQVYAASGGAQGTNIGPDMKWDMGGNPTAINFSRQRGPSPTGTYFEDYEQVMVLSKGAPDSGGTGHTLITVDRCKFAPSEYDEGGVEVPRGLVYSSSGITGNTADACVKVGDRILRATPSALEGTNAPNGVYKNPIQDNNFTQEYKYAFEKTKESDIVAKAIIIPQDALEINRWLVTRQMNRDREYSNLLGRKNFKREEASGKERYITGGVRPYIIKDIAHIIPYTGPAITWPGLLDMGKNIFKLGGSQKRTGFTGITMDAELRKSFWNEHLFYNKEASKDFNMEVNTLRMSGGSIDLICSQVMEENGYGNEILCLDMSYSNVFEPVANLGWDYKVEKNIQEPGAQVYKEQIIGMFGLRRRYRQFHCILDFSNAVGPTM